MSRGGLYLLDWFRQLRNQTGGSMGPEPIHWESVGHWAGLMRTDPRPWEIEIIMALDIAWRRAVDGQDADQLADADP